MASRLIREILADSHFILDTYAYVPMTFYREASVENGIKVIERKPAKFVKKYASFKAAGKSSFQVEYLTYDGFVVKSEFETLAKAMSFYASVAYDVSQVYKVWGETGCKLSDLYRFRT